MQEWVQDMTMAPYPFLSRRPKRGESNLFRQEVYGYTDPLQNSRLLVLHFTVKRIALNLLSRT